MNTTKFMSDVIKFAKYSKYIPEEQRRETWPETCYRNAEMHIKKFPFLDKLIYHIYGKYVVQEKVFPSMRSLQFGGRAIEQNRTRMFNCSYRAVNTIDAFSEVMFLLLGGTGLGISVQQQHIDQLPELLGPNRDKEKLYAIEDSIMGWADAIKHLMKAYFLCKPVPIFDYSGIRKRGTPLKTAGKK